MKGLEKLSESDLEAISSGDISALSDDGLRIIAGDDVKPNTSFGDMMPELGRQLGLTARHAVSGGLALPAMAGDAIMGLVNAGSGILGGPHFDSSSEALRRLQDRIFPVPQTKVERIAEDVSTAAAGAGSGAMLARAAMPLITGPAAKNVFSLLADRPMVQSIGAATGAGASGTIRERGGSPMAQLGAGMLTGTMVPTAGQIGKEILRPHTVAGRDTVVGNILRHFATDPKRAGTVLSDIPEFVPGARPTTAQASEDIGLSSLERTVRGFPGAEQAFELRNRTPTNVAIMTLLQSKIPRTGQELRGMRDEAILPRLQQMIETRKQVDSSPIAARLVSLREDPRFADRLSRNAIKTVQDELEAVGEHAADPLWLYNGPRKTLRDMVESKFDAAQNRRLQKNEIAVYEQTIKALDDVIDQGMPGFKSDYLKKYAAFSRGAGRADLLQEIARKAANKASQDAFGNPVFTKGAWMSAVLGLRNEIGGLTASQQAALGRIQDELTRSQRSATGRVTGSDTFKNITMAHMIGRLSGAGLGENAPRWVRDFSDKFGILFRMPEPRIQALLLDAVTDPKLAHRLLTKANAMSSETVGRDLIRRAVAQGYIAQGQQ